MVSDKLKPCPFCGCKATLQHDGLQVKHRNAPDFSGDFFALWTAMCTYCGTAKGKYRTEYKFNASGELEIYGKSDGKKEAVEAWNRRATNE